MAGSLTTSARWAAVVLAGGTSRRWAGRDKTAVALAGRPVLLHAVGAVLPGAAALAVVAPPDHPARAEVESAAGAAAVPLAWVREEPPGGGPVAGLAAGLAAIVGSASLPAGGTGPATGGPAVPVVVVLAGDLPFARTACPRLVAALADDAVASGTPGTTTSETPGAASSGTPGAAVGVDPGGRRQPLLAAYRVQVLSELLGGLDPAGKPLRVVLDGLHVVDVPVTAEEALDLDTPDDAGTAERVAARIAGLAGPPGPPGPP